VQLLRRAWRQYPADFGVNEWLGLLVGQTEPQRWEEAVRHLTAGVALRRDSPGAYQNLALALQAGGQWDEAIACSRKAIALDRNYAGAHSELGAALAQKGQWDEAIASCKKAIALDPKSARAYLNLGNALKDKAIALAPKHALAHSNLGHALKDKGQLDEAIACFRTAIALDPKYALAHTNLGVALAAKGKVEEAIACYHKAIALNPKSALAHTNLGVALAGKGQWDEAIACFRTAIALDPKYALTHYNLGGVLGLKGQWDEAIACFREAIALDPKFAEAHCNLGYSLARQGRFTESLTAFQRGHELGTKQPGWPYPLSAQWVRQAERLAALETKLPAFLQGEFQPTDNQERLGLAGVCQGKKLHLKAVGLYTDAFAADSRLADDLEAAHRYAAACSAALAAAGQGEDAGKLDAGERARLRQRALDWLRADLALRGKQLDSGQGAARADVQEKLRSWQQDSALAGIRDQAARDQLPAQEQKAFAQLWSDVAALLAKTADAPK
jgi:tetratricopeptide (TPR) repeat protein